MTREQAIKALALDGYLWDIGQIDLPTRRFLSRAVGIRKEKAYYPYYDSGYCEKTIYLCKEANYNV